MKARKFNKETKDFDECSVNNDCLLLPKFVDGEVPCANCGKLVPWCKGYASTIITSAHNDNLVYIVCKECHEREML